MRYYIDDDATRPFRHDRGQVRRMEAFHAAGQATDIRVPQSATAEALKARVRAEYREMPGLCLTLPQACRLWQIDVGAAARILAALVAEGFLRRTAGGAFRVAES